MCRIVTHHTPHTTCHTAGVRDPVTKLVDWWVAGGGLVVNLVVPAQSGPAQGRQCPDPFLLAWCDQAESDELRVIRL